MRLFYEGVTENIKRSLSIVDSVSFSFYASEISAQPLPLPLTEFLVCSFFFSFLTVGLFISTDHLAAIKKASQFLQDYNQCRGKTVRY